MAKTLTWKLFEGPCEQHLSNASFDLIHLDCEQYM